MAFAFFHCKIPLALPLPTEPPIDSPPPEHTASAVKPRTSLLNEFVLRARCCSLAKASGTTVFMGVFFLAYFYLLHHPSYPVTQMPLTALDRQIAFVPSALLAYASLWFYVCLPPTLLVDLRQLYAYTAWIGGLCLTGLACFYFWPTAVPPYGLKLADSAGLAILQGVDAAGNACPSLHVATAVFSAIWLDHLLREIACHFRWRVWNWLWVALICWSTLAIRQHVVLDVVAGLLLAILFAIPSLRLRPR